MKNFKNIEEVKKIYKEGLTEEQKSFIANFIENGLYEKDEIDTIKKQCAEDIAEFGRQFQIIRELYEEFGFYYPEECITNYRDSWFHYRKMYDKKEILTV